MAKQSPKPTKSSRAEREAAAAARAAAMEQQRKRQRRITIAIGVVIALLVVGIIGGAIYLSNQKKVESGVVADPNAALPTGVIDSSSQWAYGVPTGSNPKAPVVEIWEDMQCPACSAFEAQMGQTLKAKAESGEIYLINRPTTFLDSNFDTTYSRLATAAYGCAIDAGKGYEYKETVLSNQPAKEGDGWTEEQLVGFASQVGIEGDALTTFESCLTDRTYVPWAGNSTQEFIDAGIGGTPTVLIAGKQVATADVIDPVKFQQLIDEAAAAQ